MKKLTILTAILCVILLLLLSIGFRTGLNDKDSKQENHNLNNIEQTVASLDAPQSDNESTGKDQDPSGDGTGKAQFRDEKYSVDGDHISFEAVVYDYVKSEPLSGLAITRYCDGDDVATDVVTDDDGYFSLDFDDCGSISEAWVEVEYNDEITESQHIHLHYPIRLASGPSGVVSHPLGAPEFSTLTLAIAVIAVTLGIAFLRKQ